VLVIDAVNSKALRFVIVSIFFVIIEIRFYLNISNTFETIETGRVLLVLLSFKAQNYVKTYILRL